MSSIEFFAVNTKLPEEEILASKEFTAITEITCSGADDSWIKKLLLVRV